jgi:hypothetical protein
MKMKPTNAYKLLTVPYVINTEGLLHVSATLVTILMGCSTQDILQSSLKYRDADKSLARPTFLSIFFSVQGTGGSPTGPDSQNRVGDSRHWKSRYASFFWVASARWTLSFLVGLGTYQHPWQHKSTIVGFKIYSLKWMLQHKIQIKLCAKFKCVTNVLCNCVVVYHHGEVKEMCLCLGGYWNTGR